MITARIARRAALLVMVGVTGWSVWALGQPRKQAGPPAVASVAAPPPPPAVRRPSPPRPSAPPPPSAARHEPAPSGEGTEAAAEEEGDEPKAFNFGEFGRETPPYLAMLINFGILVGGYYLFGKDAIASGLRNRRDAVAKEIEEAARMKFEAEERAKRYQARLETLEQEMATARDALVRAGEAERERIVRDAEASAERMRKDAEFMVEQELKQMRLDLWRGAVDSAIAAAEELLKKRITQADQERLAEEYLADLGARPKSAAAGGAS